ncbi:ca2+ sensor protein [Sphingomonas sp. G-3-2-10]|uniref:ca2+ sensor protein n=1 Tax=Sphingomonas sp. G-3-2-10 TaxID=2728838 RepID=UPI00146EDC97|nr:ca2+ sensor protein [Sphingomonas sp. G-3-2-10]NML04997.1 ca2+ sensor protein [Sphingomonas sp. G-3-2-10]
MMIKLLSATLAAAITFGGGAAAFAQEAPPQRGGGLLMRADANTDGILTRSELIAHVEARFAKRDANKDGKIGADERGGRGPGMRSRRGGPDGIGGGNGAPTKAEQIARATRAFDYIDRNGDGKVDKAERDALRDTMAALHRGGPGKFGHGRHGHMGPPPPPPAGTPNAPQGN